MKKILIANRGEIALRIIKTCRELGIGTVAVASEPDMNALHARAADECHLIGPGTVTESYLNMDNIMAAARKAGVDAIHPGFGFLSENAAFSKRVTDEGFIFIGPSPEVMEVMGSKQISKRRMKVCGVPVVPGYNGDAQDLASLQKEADLVGYPLLIKASAGGGGKGMRVVHASANFASELETAQREARSAFGDDTVLLERYLVQPRHIEFQVFGDSHGNLVHLFERECSIQRRHQKIIEETPSPVMTPELRARMAEAAITAAKEVNYVGAGTVEFMLDVDGSFFFLEMNTRLQVEHPVTEMITGIDLVRWQILVADGEKLPLMQEQITSRGHAIEARIYAEDPNENFFPQTGTISRYRQPSGLGVRVDTGVGEGDTVSIYYDPMLAKLITYGENREQACLKMAMALEEYCIHGVKTNLGFLGDIVAEPNFREGNFSTSYLAENFPGYKQPTDQLKTALALSALGSAANTAKALEGAVIPDPWDALRSWRAMS